MKLSSAGTNPPPLHVVAIAVHLFLKQFAHSLQEPGKAKRTLSSEYQGSVLSWLRDVSDHRGETKRQVATVVAPPHIAANSSPSG